MSRTRTVGVDVHFDRHARGWAPFGSWIGVPMWIDMTRGVGIVGRCREEPE